MGNTGTVGLTGLTGLTGLPSKLSLHPIVLNMGHSHKESRCEPYQRVPVGDIMRKVRLSMNVTPECFNEYNSASRRLEIQTSAFVRIISAIGYKAVKENPEILLRDVSE